MTKAESKTEYIDYIWKNRACRDMKTEDGLITPDGDLRIAILCDCEDCRKGIFHGWIMVSVRDGKEWKDEPVSED